MPGRAHLLRVDQLLTAAELTRGNVVLHFRDHHRDNGPWLGCARDLGDHSNLHDLCFDLSEAGVQNSLAGPFGDQNSSRSHHRIDHIADAQRKLFYAAVHAGTDNGLLQFHFGLRQRRFRTCLLSRQKGGNPLLGLLFCSCSGGNGHLGDLPD